MQGKVPVRKVAQAVEQAQLPRVAVQQVHLTKLDRRDLYTSKFLDDFEQVRFAVVLVKEDVTLPVTALAHVAGY